jgi:hypothetical protein
MMKYVFRGKLFKLPYKKSNSFEDIKRKLTANHAISGEDLVIQDKKGMIILDLDGSSINPKATYTVGDDYEEIAGQKKPSVDVKVNTKSESSDSDSILQPALETPKPLPVLPEGPFISKILLCPLCKDFNIEGVSCVDCEMPACQVCFDAHIKQHHRCPSGCFFPQAVKVVEARKIDIELRKCFIELTKIARDRVERLKDAMTARGQPMRELEALGSLNLTDSIREQQAAVDQWNTERMKQLLAETKSEEKEAPSTLSSPSNPLIVVILTC